MTLLGIFHTNLVFHIQITLAGAQQHIIHIRLEYLCERAVALDREFQVGAIITHHIDEGFRQFVAVLLIHPSRHCLQDFRTLKREDVLPTFAVVARRTKVATVMHSFESHAEVVGRRVERILLILHDGASDGIFVGDEDVQTSHARVTVGREIEVAIRTERRKHLVACRVDGTSEVLHAAKSAAEDACAPNVQTAFTTLCIADKIEPLTIGTDCWMGKGGERVARNHTLGRLAP